MVLTETRKKENGMREKIVCRPAFALSVIE